MIIAISGKIGSGKTTLAKELKNRLNCAGVQAEVVSFATILRKVCGILFGYDYNESYSIEQKSTPLKLYPKETRGSVLQKIGTCLREFDQDIFVKALLSGIKEGTIYIIDDLRYLNEYSNIRKNIESITVRLNGTFIHDDTRCISHPSEVELDNISEWDIVFEIDSSLTERVEKILDFI